DGLGVRRDVAEAAKWYERAARQGNVVAQSNLGDLHAEGRGVRRDLVEAYVWLSLAAQQGHRWSEDRRKEIARAMTDDQIAAADEKVRTWGPAE
ncbi:MAG: tetratricopeptide repeat protein, partial [Burkholderiales bacterium]